MKAHNALMIYVLMNVYAMHAGEKAGLAIGGTLVGGSTALLIGAQQYFSSGTANVNVAEMAMEEWVLEVPVAPQTTASGAVTESGAMAESAAAAESAELVSAEAAVTAAGIAAAVTIVVIIVAVVALATISLWLPPILKQSGVANSTLYEVKAYIDFQGEVGSSCSRAHLVLYPYSRKDLGAPWQEVGGDRGRACIPARYGARVYIAMRGATVQCASSLKDQAKHMKNINIKTDKTVRIQWANV